MPINPFVGILAGDPFSALNKTQEATLDIAGQAALGRGIQQMFNPGTPQPIPIPGGGQGGGILGGIGQGLQGLGQRVGQLFGGGGQGQPTPTGAPMSGPMGGQPQLGPSGPGPMTQATVPNQQGPQPPQTPSQTAGAVPPGAGAAIYQMSYPQLFQAVARANQGQNPAVIARAMMAASKFMNPLALEQWRADQSARGWTGLGIREQEAQTHAETAQGRMGTQSVAVQDRILAGQIKTWENLRDTNQVNADEANRQISALMAQRNALLSQQGGRGPTAPGPTAPGPTAPGPTAPTAPTGPTSTMDPRSTLTPDQLKPPPGGIAERFGIKPGVSQPPAAPAAPAASAFEPQTNAGKADPSLVESIASYDTKGLNEGLGGAKGNTNRQIMADVRRLNPNWDATVFGTRQGTEKDFASGFTSRKINQFNTAIPHMAQLARLAEALKTGNIQIINQARQAYQQATGQPAPAGYNVLKPILAGEILGAIIPGPGGVTERESFGKKIEAAQSPEQFAEVFKDLREAASKQINALRQKYKAGGGKQDFDNTFLAPETRALLQPSAKTESGKTGATPAAPSPGTIMDGHRFKGGDPSKPENWEAVK